MAKAFRPHAHLDSGFHHIPDEVMVFPTYAELKREMKHLIEKAPNKMVRVYRHRRGEWGEWFEHWKFDYKRKPYIVKEGWC